jgi:hypothetical protein
MSEIHRPKPEDLSPALPAVDGYEVICPADEPYAYCDGREGPVYLMQAQFEGVGREPLHEHCARYWFEWYGKAGQV